MFPFINAVLKNLPDEHVQKAIKNFNNESICLVLDGEFSGLKGELAEMNKANGTNYEPQLLQIVAKLVTLNGTVIGRFNEVVIGFTEEYLTPRLSEWSAKQHAKTGLLDKVYASTTTYKEVETALVEFLLEHGFSDFDRHADRQVYLTGNSIENDQHMLFLHLSEVLRKMHYQIINISSFKVIFNALDYRVPALTQKVKDHTAMADVDESIRELLVYIEIIKWGLYNIVWPADLPAALAA